MGKTEKGPQPAAAAAAERVVVAVKAAKEIPRTALVWALTNVVQPNGCLTLLVVVPTHSPGRKVWGFPLFAGDCASGHKKSHSETSMEQKADISELCSHMMVQLHDVYDPNKVNVKIKIVPGSPCGVVAAESKRAQASWVVLDKQLKNEEKHCLQELQCNIVAMKRSQPKVLRLNLVGSPEPEPEPVSVAELDGSSGDNTKNSIRGSSVTPTSSPEVDTPFSTTEAGTSSVSTGSDTGTSPFFASELNSGPVKQEKIDRIGSGNLHVTSSDSDNEGIEPEFEPWVAEILSATQKSSKQVEDLSHRLTDRTHISKGSVADSGIGIPSNRSDLNSRRNGKEVGISSPSYGGSVRETILLSRNSPPGPPPLCSICQHKAPVFGKSPRWFSYAELELATGGFSQANFLAEGGYGSVHRGILPDGRAVAVKQHKVASSQGDLEFYSEVEVLSCAQHCNVVMLIGYCAEDSRRLLVYEYICNGSLHSHLYGRNREPLEWSARQKIAVGAARGLRYLHEDCRVGCIVHRDMRPHNILLTHDFKPLVGDFGLARCQPDGDHGEDTRVIGTIGYMAPEYSQTGQISEKADVYSFGVVLVELITGRKAMDISRPKGQQLLSEWARPLLEENAIHELIDPRIQNWYSEREVFCMMHAALLCIRRDPRARPKMSQVLRMLEGDIGMELSYGSTSGGHNGSRSGRIRPDHHHQQQSDGRDYSYGDRMSGKKIEREGKTLVLR